MPVLAPSALMPDGVQYEFGNWVVGTDPHFARVGFAVIDCIGQSLHVEYVDEDGVPHNSEDYAAPGAAAAS